LPARNLGGAVEGAPLVGGVLGNDIVQGAATGAALGAADAWGHDRAPEPVLGAGLGAAGQAAGQAVGKEIGGYESRAGGPVSDALGALGPHDRPRHWARDPGDGTDPQRRPDAAGHASGVPFVSGDCTSGIDVLRT